MQMMPLPVQLARAALGSYPIFRCRYVLVTGMLNRNKPVRNEPGVLVYSAADVTARLLADYGVTEASLR